MFFILQVSDSALSIDAKRHIWFTERASIFAFLLLLLYYWGLCCEILQLNFSLKYYPNGTLNGCVFEPVRFGVVMGNTTGEARFQTSHKMYVHENLVVIPRWKDFPFTRHKKDRFCANERTQNFVLCD